MSHDRDTAFVDMDQNNHHHNHFMNEEAAAAAAAAVASVRAAHYADYAQQISPLQEAASLADSEANAKIKRARSAQKITRNRKITSCLQCRERKQKVGLLACKEGNDRANFVLYACQCDRQKPLCGNCSTASTRGGGLCTYVDTVEEAQEVLANEGEKDAK